MSYSNPCLSIAARLIRTALGSLLIALVLLVDQMPIWFALLATYPLFTAMMTWDPFYAVLGHASRMDRSIRTPRLAEEPSR